MHAASDYPTVDGVAILSLDNPPVNSLSGAQRGRLGAMLQHAAARSDVQAIVITGKGGTFCGGADVREFNTPAQRMSPIMPELIEGCDKIDKVVVAAIEGFAYGAGLELALALHYRVAGAESKLGLPEVKFGFLPGAGGTQRLPRLVPMDKAADMMLSGAAVTAEEAHQLGLVDAIFEGDVLSAAVDFARSKVGQLRRTRDLPARVDALAPGYLAKLRDKVEAGAQGNIAKLHIVDCCAAAVGQPFDQGLAYERERFLAMLGTPESKALRHVFFAERQAAKISRLGADVKPRPVQSAAVIGAGTMGSG
ncbi:MAG TPA: enoyl-CoA hydratase-related protein, partial [Pseudoduganella sp.]